MTENQGPVVAYVEEDAAGYCRMFHLGQPRVGGKDCANSLGEAAEYITDLEASRRALMGAVEAVLEAPPGTPREAHARIHLRQVFQQCQDFA